MQLPPAVKFDIDNELITIRAFNTDEIERSLLNKPVNIIASGPSIADIAFSELLDMATIFVNGSISLLTEHNFSQVVGWVISDARFIHHQPQILKDHYHGQPLYIHQSLLPADVQSASRACLHRKAQKYRYTFRAVPVAARVPCRLCR